MPVARAITPAGNSGYLDVRNVSDVDEGVVEGGEDACDAEDKLACCGVWSIRWCTSRIKRQAGMVQTFSDLRSKGDVLLRAALDLLLGCHLC